MWFWVYKVRGNWCKYLLGLRELKERAWNTTPITRFRADKTTKKDEILWERKNSRNPNYLKKSSVLIENFQLCSKTICKFFLLSIRGMYIFEYRSFSSKHKLCLTVHTTIFCFSFSSDRFPRRTVCPEQMVSYIFWSSGWKERIRIIVVHHFYEVR